MTNQPKADSQMTIEALLDLSKRDHLPLSTAFVQARTRGGKPTPGPLSSFVTDRRERALQLYLLAHAAASGGDFAVTRAAPIWMRALDLDPARDSSSSALSRQWQWLESRRLIDRRRDGRHTKVTLLRDDGTGRAYVHPSRARPRSPYFKLPYAFWRDEWHRKLDLAATASLLIALSLPQGFVLQQDRVNEWYGIAGSTWDKGARRLRRLGVLDIRRNQKAAPLSPLGFTFEYRYTLQGPFAPQPAGKRRRRKARRGTGAKPR